MKKSTNKIIFSISLLIFLLSGVILLKMCAPEKDYTSQFKNPNATESFEATHELPTQETTTINLPENPIDFAKLQSQNPDLYSWIMIPGTDIDYPVAQSDPYTDDLFYLDHNIDKKYEFAGTIFSQKHNKKDYSDPVTLLYGHNMLNGSMFADLLDMRDRDYFDEIDTIYIYTPGHILTYRIVSAYVYDNRHILNSFDFTKTEDLQEYIDSLTSPRSLVCNVREGITVTTSDKILTLSTCTGNDSQRYLVQGVLIDDELTK